jgi:putative spermidine/putrescine transport system substrate-binding protein
MGKPAAEALMGIDQQPLIKKGMLRQGGSYIERMGHIGVWNSVMDEHNYLVRKWKNLMQH